MDEMTEGLVKTDCRFVELIMKRYCVGVYENKRLRPGAKYPQRTIKAMKASVCKKESLPNLLRYLLRCDKKINEPPMYDTVANVRDCKSAKTRKIRDPKPERPLLFRDFPTEPPPRPKQPYDDGEDHDVGGSD